MYSIEIYAAFDFLEIETKVGTLEYERTKGSPSFRFYYDELFLSAFPGVKLSADIGLFPGIQSASGNIFSCLGDTLPDRWGRALIDKRERLTARKAKKVPRQFDDFGYLIRIDDITRMGALRFKYKGAYLGIQPQGYPIPPLTSLDNFIREAHELELAEKKGDVLLQEEWLDNVWKQGSSLGGARPKANIIIDGQLWIAKIPSIKDSYDIALWEYFAMTLASKAGINAAETQLIRVGPTPYHTLLSKRFDRKGDRRIHFASSLTLAGLHDGSGADDGKGYIDIADSIVGDIMTNRPQENLMELYRRAAYNILIGNHDDHFRNHGFLLRKNGWELSPAYDINPTNITTQSLMVSPLTNRSSLKELLHASDYYLIDRKTAQEIIKETYDVVKEWKTHAESVGIPAGETDRFAKRIDFSIKEGDNIFPAEKTIEIHKTENNNRTPQQNHKHKGPSR